ncbi:hypothetical protein KEG38_21015 [Polyangium jinanense]|uniref:hypothetical protein n=1 Tax=Polyangium jinanense TaxID=2829994 RepID=UPI002341DB49|nr:hypothetical protein [Polyangium jinanense]MDC3952210.1 hypothetical protein [Polyangium jinanense]MDC3956355.1 hypothetical protein [Polyangium jinanense]
MKIQRRHIGGVAALLALGGLLGAGCAENRSSLFVRGALVFDTDTCGVVAETTAPTLLRGTLDVAFASEYNAALLVGNQLVRRGNAATLRTETSRVQFESADVHTFDAAGNELGAFTAPATGFVDPSTGAEPGLGFANVVLVDSGTSAAALGASGGSGTPVEVLANVIIRGRTLGGEEVATGEWQFPIDVCRGCLVFFPPEADDLSTPERDCFNPADAPSGFCRPGIDNAVDCRLCRGLDPVCDSPSL